MFSLACVCSQEVPGPFWVVGMEGTPHGKDVPDGKVHLLVLTPSGGHWNAFLYSLIFYMVCVSYYFLL